MKGKTRWRQDGKGRYKGDRRQKIKEIVTGDRIDRRVIVDRR